MESSQRVGAALRHEEGAVALELTAPQSRRLKLRALNGEWGGTRYELQTICIGFSQGTATIIERI